jgi:class 3 adenylate cyclase/tetratricopeptide (TPR) repeat protein
VEAPGVQGQTGKGHPEAAATANTSTGFQSATVFREVVFYAPPMRCTACQTENREGRRFCASCGAELVVACPACGAANEPGDRFCGACGTALAGAIPPPAAPATERRMVSVLFADLVGFTALSGPRDPEEVRELLSSYFETARRTIERHGGTVEKFIGDAVMAVWGAPVAQEDDAERAVRVALELVDGVRALGDRTGTELDARAGVATGDAAVTVGAVGQGIVAGDLVNTASRIQGAAAPASVLVDETTRRMTEAAIVCEPAGTFELKGKPDPLALWRAVRVTAARRGAGRSAGLDPPFVGRERELRLLKDLFHAAEGGRAHLVTVSGIAGIGKSRLAWEFEKYADGLADEVLWHRGRCLSYRDGVAFWALAEMVRMRARIAEDEPAASADPKLVAAVHEWVTDPADREWVLDPLRSLLGLAQAPERDREHLFPAWRRFFEAMAERLPVALVFEDVQWADEALLSFVEYLLEWSRGHRLFVLALARPELGERRPGWGATSRALTSLALEPLTDEAMTALVSGMVPGLPDAAVGRIVAAAEGVPLYAVETARMLLDRGLVARAGGGFRVAGDLAEIEIPETLHALVAARLDGLAEDERRLLQQAAVLGKSFTPEGLAAISGVPPEHVEAVLAALARKELLSIQTDPRSPERGQYGFVQDIVRTIARDTLGRRERKRLHLATADHLTRLGGDELAEVIAAHRLDAYRVLPDDPDAGELRDLARTDILRAADRAASVAAPAEAHRLVVSALELAPDGAGQADLHERAGVLALRKGDVTEAEAAFTRAVEQAGDTRSAARVRARRGDVLYLLGRADDAVAEMEAAYAVLAGQAPDADLAHLAAQIGRLTGMIGVAERGREPLERALEIAETLDLPDVLSDALNTKGLWTLAFTPRREEGRSLLLGALRVALEADMFQAAMRAYFNLSFEREGVDDYSNDYDSQGLALAERTGDEQWRRSFLMHLAFLASELGDWDAALRHGEEATRTAGAEADVFAQGVVLTGATVLARRGQVAAAREMLESIRFDESVGDEQNRALLWAARAELLAAEGRDADAAAAASNAVRVNDGLWLGHPAVKAGLMLETWCALRAGDRGPTERILAQLADEPLARQSPRLRAHLALLRAMLAPPAEAPGAFAEAVAQARSGDAPWHLAVALAEQANAGIDREAALAEARTILERLGAAPALERLAGAAMRTPASAAG